MENIGSDEGDGVGGGGDGGLISLMSSAATHVDVGIDIEGGPQQIGWISDYYLASETIATILFCLSITATISSMIMFFIPW